MKTNSLRLPRCLGIAALAFATFVAPARAVIIVSLDPITQNIAVGGTAVVNLNISGLDAGLPPGLGSWLAQLSYNSAVVGIGAADVTFGPHMDLGVFGTFDFVDPSTAGLLKLDRVSLEDTAALIAAQPASFTLASLQFTGLAPGVSQVGFGRIELGNAAGFPLEFSKVPASITVGTVGVPDGGPLTLAAALCLTLICLVHARRSRIAP